ncbi:MAG: hypothetical protein D6798_00985, partial [Deltaproteobacteria bacterium]
MSRDRDTLHVLPIPAGLARERASDARLQEEPRAIQEWLDALAECPGQDARLRRHVEELAAEAPTPGEASPPAPPDATIGAWLAATA